MVWRSKFSIEDVRVFSWAVVINEVFRPMGRRLNVGPKLFISWSELYRNGRVQARVLTTRYRNKDYERISDQNTKPDDSIACNIFYLIVVREKELCFRRFVLIGVSDFPEKSFELKHAQTDRGSRCW